MTKLETGDWKIAIRKSRIGNPAIWLRSPAFLCSVVLALTFAAYAETLSFDFVHDDRGQIVDNPAIHSWASVPQYFTAQVWAGVSPQELGNYYRPLFLLWLRINYVVLGLHPWAWHLTTILVHMGVTLLVYFLAFRVLGDPFLSSVAALIFGLHPAHIEGVAWISGVTEPLLGLLLVSSFLCYLKKRDQPAKAAVWMASSLAFYVLAILEKETALVLPPIIFCYEWVSSARPGVETPRRGVSAAALLQRAWRGLRSAVPYLLPVPFYFWARVHALRGFSHVATGLPLSAVLYTWPSLLWFWVKHLVWPVGLSTFYDLPSVTQPNFYNFTLPAIGVAAVGLGLFWGALRFPEIALAGIWLVLPLLPILDIRVFRRSDFAHDRYLYLPSVGLAIIAAVLLRRLRLGSAKLQGVPAAQIVPTLLVAALMIFGTTSQSFYFQDNLVFYEHNVASAPENRIPLTNLASLLGEAGQYEKAVSLYQRVLKGDLGDWYANYNLGYTYYRMGKLQEAETYLEKAIAISPNKPDEHFYLGLALLRMGHTGEAASALRRAIEIRPDGFGYHSTLGLALKLQGNLQGALSEFKAEISFHPEQALARQQIAEIQATLNSRLSSQRVPP
jgi:tetratricopeptide (TPR) repeat protein